MSVPPPLSADAQTLGREAAEVVAGSVRDGEYGDFLEAVRRAAAQSTDLFSPQDLEEAEAIATRGDDALAGAINFGTLEDFLDDASDYAAAAPAGEVPPLPLPAAPRRRWLVAVGVVGSIAAAVLLTVWIGLDRWSADSAHRDGAPDFASAVDRALDRESGGMAEPRKPPRKPAPRRNAVAPEPAPAPTPALEETAPDATTPEAPPPRRPKPSRQERLERLDADARAAWRRGDLAQAQREFEALVRLGGTRSIADIAYGDLFSLARKQGDTGGLAAHWRRYAKKFPKGRYIDDARAGLCRIAAKSEQRACWEAYLRDRPQGTYHRHARDVLAHPK